MEILMFIMIILSDKSGEEIRIQDYHRFSQENGIKVGCEEFVSSKTAAAKVIKKSGYLNAEFKCVPTEKLKKFLNDAVGTDSQKMESNESALENGKKMKLEGKLLFTPLKNSAKSVDAYLGKEYYIPQKDGDVILKPGRAWTSDRLKTYINKKVEVECTYYSKSPEPYEQYPMTMDSEGNSVPMKRTWCEIESVKIVK